MTGTSLSPAEYNAQVFVSKGVNIWRRIYLALIEKIKPQSVIEFGAGDPCLLDCIPENVKRVAVDGTSTYRGDFLKKGISFIEADLNRGDVALEEKFDLAICSDVFEHLIAPEVALGLIARSLNANGILFAHVPNEFTLRKTMKVMLGRDEAMYSHPHCEEWTHPHLHRFTDKGFQKFLNLKFAHLVCLTQFGDSPMVARLRRAKIPIPYCLEGGATYACTNDTKVAQKLERICSTLTT